MKRYKTLYYTPWLFLFVLLACSHEAEIKPATLPEGKFPIMFAVRNFIMPVTTRSLTDNCIVKVSMTDNIAGIADTDKNYVYRLSDNTLEAQQTPYYWSDANQILTVRAYYPANATISDITNQSNIGQYHNFDVLYATNSISFNERETKSLTFNHLMSRIEIRLALKNNHKSNHIQSVQIANTITQGILNGIPSNPSASISGSTKGYITACVHETSDDTAKYQAVVIPQTVSASPGSPVNLIYVSLEQHKRTYHVPLTTSLTFEAGKTYTFTMDLY